MHNVDVHCDLAHNTALRYLELHFNKVRVTKEDQGLDTEVADKLYGVLSTVRSHQLEHIEIATTMDWRIYLPRAPLLELLPSTPERVDLRPLHEAISQPHFNTLKDVNVKMDTGGPRPMVHTKADVEDASRKSEAMFRRILRPWSDCGIIKHITSLLAVCASRVSRQARLLRPMTRRDCLIYGNRAVSLRSAKSKHHC